MIRFACPRCKSVLEAPDRKVGAKVACPKCQQRLQIPVPPTKNKTILAPFVGHGPDSGICQPKPSAEKAPPVPQPVTTRKPSKEAPNDLSNKRRVEPPEKALTASKVPLAFGIASLALSIIGLVFSLIPLLGAWFAIPLCGLGMLLGIIGGVFALIRQRHGIGFPLAGSITGFAGLGIAIMWLTVCSGIFSSVNRSLKEAAQRAEQEKGEAIARKDEADAVEPVGQERKDPGATEKRQEVPKKDIQPPPPKPQKPPAKKSSDVVKIKGFLCISPDFTAYALATFGGVRIVELNTGKNLVSPEWDKDWGLPISAAFGNDIIAIVTGRGFGGGEGAVKIFSRKTGELQQNIHGREFNRATLTADGRFLAFTEFRCGSHYLVLRDIQEKKMVAELPIGGSGYCSLAVAGKLVAVHESNRDQITVVEADSGKLVEQLKSGTSPEKKGFGESRMPLAISPEGNVLAWGAQDEVVLYDIANGKVAHKLEGHLDSVGAIAFSPNGEIVASAAKDKTIRFWNVKQGKVIHVVKDLPAKAVSSNFSSAVPELIFSMDGDRIAVVYAGSREAEIRSVKLK